MNLISMILNSSAWYTAVVLEVIAILIYAAAFILPRWFKFFSYKIVFTLMMIIASVISLCSLILAFYG